MNLSLSLELPFPRAAATLRDARGDVTRRGQQAHPIPQLYACFAETAKGQASSNRWPGPAFPEPLELAITHDASKMGDAGWATGMPTEAIPDFPFHILSNVTWGPQR